MNLVVGDLIWGREVIEIFKDQVILETGRIQAVLKLRNPSFPIKIRIQN